MTDKTDSKEREAPDDGQLAAIYKQANGEDVGKAQPLTTQRIFRAMRAALARWGQPSGSGEPVAWMDDFGNTFPLGANKGAGSWLDAHKRNWKPLYTTTQPTQAMPPAGREPTIQWPKERDVGRIGDMSPGNFLRVGLDSDHDAYVSVCGEDGMGSVEFCVPGAGGGKSSRTRLALIALMVAMEADNAEDPGRDWWGRRMGGIKGGQHGAP